MLALFDKGLSFLVRGVEDYLTRFDSKTGRFLTKNGGWSPQNQENMVTLAFLYKTAHLANPYYKNEKLLDVVEKAGTALRQFQYSDGKIEFLKIDGSKWGASYIAWTFYHWLETCALIGNDLSEKSKKSWREGLMLAYGGINEMLDGIRVHNINVLHATALNRAAQVLCMPDWLKTADEMISRAVHAQKEPGYWEEHFGPTTSYNHLYVYALGLYHCHGGKVDVLNALEKSLYFHEVFTYPDGACVETIDGRIKYNKLVKPVAMAGLALFQRGRDYCRFLMEQAEKNNNDLFLPNLTTFLMNLKADLGESPALVRKKQFEIDFMNVLVEKKQDIFVCMSGITAPPVSEIRWAQDRQMFLSVWHQSYGLLIGGGNSKNQAERSTFVISKNSTPLIYIPVSGSVDPDKKELNLYYGDMRCSICIDLLDTNIFEFSYRSEINEDYEACLNLPIILVPGSKLITDVGITWDISEDSIDFTKGSGKHWIQVNSARIEFDGPASFKWPSRPFNPHEKDGIAPLEQSVAILTLVSDRKSRKVSIKF